MNVHALPLRRLSRVQAGVASYLAREPWMPFTVEDRLARLVLRPSQRAPVGLHWFECSLGALGLSEAHAVLNAWSTCPAFIGSETQDNWRWPLYNGGLAEQLAAVLGTLQPINTPSEPRLGFTYCELTLQTVLGRIDSMLALPTQALAKWLEQPIWNAPPTTDHSGLKVSFALRLGRLSLPWQTVTALRPGDVVCPSTPDFDIDGNGVLTLGTWQLRVRAGDRADRLQLEILSIEESTMADHEELAEPSQAPVDVDDHDINTPTEDDQEEGKPPVHSLAELPDENQDAYESDSLGQYPDEGTALRPFDDLAVPLTLRCGQLRLTLGELATLAPGAVIEVPGAVPGLAELYYGDRRLAQGDLVDVEGRLGLQITQMDGRG